MTHRQFKNIDHFEIIFLFKFIWSPTPPACVFGETCNGTEALNFCKSMQKQALRACIFLWAFAKAPLLQKSYIFFHLRRNQTTTVHSIVTSTTRKRTKVSKARRPRSRGWDILWNAMGTYIWRWCVRMDVESPKWDVLPGAIGNRCPKYGSNRWINYCLIFTSGTKTT